jgi:hypothetical protein
MSEINAIIMVCSVQKTSRKRPVYKPTRTAFISDLKCNERLCTVSDSRRRAFTDCNKFCFLQIEYIGQAVERF